MKVPFYGLKSLNSEQIFLSETESRHCIKVLRYKTGDKVYVLDGRGGLYYCSIINDNPKECILSVDSTDYKENTFCSLHIVVAPPKNPDRLDWLIEKAVEMGASKISFIQSERTIRKKIKLERLERISISAMKQSCSRYKLIINDIEPLSNVLKNINSEQRFIAHLEKEKKVPIYSIFKPKKNTCILIGPEGDFTISEINMTLKNGFKSVCLGERRLRIETAVIMTIGAFNYVNGY